MNRPTPAHALMDQFPVAGGELQVGGLPLSRLAERVGQTPFYAYDRRLLSERVETLRQALPESLHLHYAIKANPMPAVVQHMAGLVDGMDLASAGEMQVALAAGVAPEALSFAGPGKRPEELRAAVAAGVTLNVESFRELERIAEASEALGHTGRVAVRVNPDFELKTSGMKMSGGAKVFGVDAEQVPELFQRIRSHGLEFRGLHIYSGSQNLRPEALVEAHAATFELGYRLAREAPDPLSFFNIGGGFGIPYFPGEQRLDLEPVAESLQRHTEEARRELGDTQLVLELGRYLVGEAGVFVARVIDRKVSRGQVFLVTDGGLHHHLAASGNFGQILRKNYPVAIGNRMDATEREPATVTGPLCTPLDVLAEKAELAPAEPGDLVVVYQSGAYGLTASPTRFLSHPEPEEVLV